MNLQTRIPADVSQDSRVPADRTCAWCGTPFTPRRPDTRHPGTFCSRACTARAAADRRASPNRPPRIPIRQEAA